MFICFAHFFDLRGFLAESYHLEEAMVEAGGFIVSYILLNSVTIL